MDIKEIAYRINEIGASDNSDFSKIQEIRAKHLDKQPRTWSPFASYSIKDNYAFHSGGREELQFNIGQDYINEKIVFRFGIAFSLEQGASLTDAIGVFKEVKDRYNHFIKTNPDYFKDFSFWHYESGNFGEFCNSVKEIDEQLFRVGNFIFIGKYIEKEVHEVNDSDIKTILKAFDYLLPAYEEIQFGKTVINEKRISRLAYNSNGWVMPSGPYGKSNHKDSHEANYGYGHEEWLFDTSKLIDGYHYGFLEPIRKQQDAYLGHNFNVWLYTIDGVSKSRYWVGEVNNLEVINQEKANSIKSIYKKNGWLKEMEVQIVESGANNRGFSDWEGVDLFNVRFKPKDLIVNDPYFELPQSHPVIGLSRYNFSHFKDDFVITLKKESQEPFSFSPDNDDENSEESEGVERTQHKREPKTIEITYLHKAISKQLTKVLKEKYGQLRVKAEHPSGIGANKVDIVVDSENEGLIFYEIKTYNAVKSSIREAIGQLFEYSFWPNVDNAKQLVILTQKHNDLDDVKTYFKHLREKLGIPIYYQWFDIEKNELSEKY
ncbi:hypothetical protein [Marinifilum flexuosum]|uniref:hypothetical protein n=1 Tax=Marinifilum flexuosum TaxID=1117708 RepID=UPI00249363FD|nr:hypothetical protein [Marinifilum flexuosum]